MKNNNQQLFSRQECAAVYRITSNNSRGNYQLFTIFPAGIIRGRELLEGGNY